MGHGAATFAVILPNRIIHRCVSECGVVQHIDDPLPRIPIFKLELVFLILVRGVVGAFNATRNAGYATGVTLMKKE